MGEGIRQHVPVIVAVTVIGIATATMLLIQVHDNAASMDASMFSNLIFVIPCAVMLVGSLVIAATSHVIGRQLYITVMGICLVTGVISMLVTSAWVQDPTIQAALLANTPGAEVVPAPTQSPLIVLRDIAAFVVMATVGCIAGAWIGSRIHPMRSEKGARKKKQQKRN